MPTIVPGPRPLHIGTIPEIDPYISSVGLLNAMVIRGVANSPR
jgi:hypothetical protein